MTGEPDGIRDPGSGIRSGVQAIVFDFDGVIADSERLHLKSYQDILAPEGITISNEDYYAKYLGYDDVGVFKALGKDQGVPMDDGRVRTLIERKGERYESLAAAGEMLFPGAADFIRAAAAVVPIAVASGALTHEIDDVLERAGLRSLFSVVVGADQTERSKPNPEPYLTAFAQLRQRSGLDLMPWRSVAIEDSKWGLMSARGADLRCVAVTNTYSAAELRSEAELVVPGLHALTIAALDALCAD
ncbi:MAG: HAD family hydrolase [Acidobacteria bacterium]|nr:HAD family hydrolase [Acidobacteriota bacterium]MSO62512.1 HAD family hydrolase [Acidobacteriota bacterium]